VKPHLFHLLIILFAAFSIATFIYALSVKNSLHPPVQNKIQNEIPFAEITIFPTVEYTYYPVYGNTVQEIQNQLSGALGTDKDNTPVTAYASWDLNWEYPKIKTTHSCTMGRPITMLLDVDYTMPQWNVEENVSTDLKNRWDRFYKQLTIHEEGHIQIALDTAYETLKQFYALPSFPTCTELDDAAFIIGRDLKYAAWDKGDLFDDTTNHGYTQGARFE
jgi:predicted secreted Zn-dependent protease